MNIFTLEGFRIFEKLLMYSIRDPTTQLELATLFFSKTMFVVIAKC